MSLLSQSEFARKAGVTRQAIRFAVKEGRLILTAGKIDPNNAANADYLDKKINTTPHEAKNTIKTKSTTNRVNLNDKLTALKIQREKNKLLKESGDYIPRTLIVEAFAELENHIQASVDKVRDKFGAETAEVLKAVMDDIFEKTMEVIRGFKK